MIFVSIPYAISNPYLELQKIAKSPENTAVNRLFAFLVYHSKNVYHPKTHYKLIHFGKVKGFVYGYGTGYA